LNKSKKKTPPSFDPSGGFAAAISEFSTPFPVPKRMESSSEADPVQTDKQDKKSLL
jgi:hypothetical protein